ncbi:hypothetical protein ACE5IS_08350 [Leptospira wolffii]|uniref:Uncharacterized protein n=1 Tax=Leptospira wolffii TaxID=409998 RepID=A0ABV5BQ06_9LEPT|nr:hypothetical protein [Leptospira wolffii]
MVQISEALNLVFDSIGLVVILGLYRAGILPKYLYLFLGFVFVWLSSVFTVLEGFFLPDFLNFLEHLSFLFSGFLFLIGFYIHFGKKSAV